MKQNHIDRPVLSSQDLQESLRFIQAFYADQFKMAFNAALETVKRAAHFFDALLRPLS